MFQASTKLLISLAAFWALALAPVFAQKAASVPKAEKPAVAGTFQNPIFNRDFPDPTVIRARDGFFYAYATQTVVDGKLHHIQVARSRDLVNWEQLADALPQRPVWADKPEPKFWAPHVHEADGKYFLYYSADPNTLTGLCLAVAVADKPAGPFKDIGRPLQCGESFINIDPMAFDDPKTGKKYLYWGSGFQPIKVRELADDRISFAPGSRTIDLIAPHKTEDLNDYQRLVEGAWVIYRKGFYYLFYSGDNCCGEKAHYAAMVARSRSATGPFETLAQATGRPNSVILEKNDEWIAPGHNSVVRDDAGDDWIVYHAINVRQRNLAQSATVAGDRDVLRVMLMNRLVYKNGWPFAEGGTPTTKPRKAPKIRR
jgi:arabinan endo-1,5-alpha-L-arabinosidase